MGAAAGSGLLESVPFVGKGLDMFESVWQVADGFVSTVLGLLLIAGAVLAYLLAGSALHPLPVRHPRLDRDRRRGGAGRHRIRRRPM